ncbi:15606_t:CDS:10 [Rhizophagus irregularis]|nr:15606_t:CDS:10 [Rhizophagus irregularis]
MRFEKRIQTEVVPEWRIKYIDYKGLKKKLRNVQREKLARDKEFMQNNDPSIYSRDSRPQSPHLEEIPSSFNDKGISVQSQRTFSMNSVADSVQDFFHKVSSALVTLQRHQSLSSNNKPRPSKITSLETLMDQVDPKERLFFTALDGELEKIEHFYKLQEIKATNRMNLLVQQYEKLKEKGDERKHSFEVWNTPKAFVKQSIDFFTSSNIPGSVTTISLDADERRVHYKIAKKNIKKAVFEFYRGADLLKKYRVLNYNGFSKILKKYDKISERNGSQIYMQKVTNAYFVKSDVIKKLLKDTEDFYVENFEGGSRSQALQKLRMPNKENKTYYYSILRIGLYLGLSLSALVRALVEMREILENEEKNTIWPKLIELYSGFFLAIVFLLLLGVNMYIWTMSHINYKFIFEFDTRSNLDFRQYLEIPSIIFLVMCYVMLFNFQYKPSDQLISPIILVISIVAILFNPFRILYYNARKWFLFSVTRLLGSGILRVEFRDFFLADILVSLTYSLSTLRLFGCINETGCFDVLTPLLASLPATFRLLQTSKRCFDTLQVNHFINIGKYGTTILAIWMLYIYRNVQSPATKASWAIVQFIASTYAFSWDVKMDWSLCELHSENYLLRDELGFESHWVYYFAIISNFILRMSWILLLFIEMNHDISKIIVFLIASGEMLRRFQWCIFRVENEHVNNCVQFRAIKEVPLPFPMEESENVDVVTTDYDRAPSLASWSSWSKRFEKRKMLTVIELDRSPISLGKYSVSSDRMSVSEGICDGERPNSYL